MAKQPKSAFKGGVKSRGLKKSYKYARGGRVVKVKAKKSRKSR